MHYRLEVSHGLAPDFLTLMLDYHAQTSTKIDLAIVAQFFGTVFLLNGNK